MGFLENLIQILKFIISGGIVSRNLDEFLRIRWEKYIYFYVSYEFLKAISWYIIDYRNVIVFFLFLSCFLIFIVVFIKIF